MRSRENSEVQWDEVPLYFLICLQLKWVFIFVFRPRSVRYLRSCTDLGLPYTDKTALPSNILYAGMCTYFVRKVRFNERCKINVSKTIPGSSARTKLSNVATLRVTMGKLTMKGVATLTVVALFCVPTALASFPALNGQNAWIPGSCIHGSTR